MVITMGSYMSSFDDSNFWGVTGTGRKHRKHRSHRKSRRHMDQMEPMGRKKSKKEVRAFEKGIIVGMKMSRSGRRKGRRSTKGPYMGPNEFLGGRRFSVKREKCQFGDDDDHDDDEGEGSSFGRPRSTLLRPRRSRKVNPDASNAMRLYQHRRSSNPGYTLKQAWEEIRSGSPRQRSQRRVRFGVSQGNPWIKKGSNGDVVRDNIKFSDIAAARKERGRGGW